MKLTQLLTIHFRLCNQNTAGYHRSILLFPIHFNFRTDKSNNGFRIVLCTNHKQLITKMEDSITIRNTDMTVLQYTRTNKVTPHEVSDLKQRFSCQRLIMYFQVHHTRSQMRICSFFFSDILFLLFQINPANVADSNNRTNDTQHSQRISARISHRYLRATVIQLAQRFVGSTQSRRVRYGTTKNTHHHRQLYPAVQTIIQSHSHSNVQCDNPHCH